MACYLCKEESLTYRVVRFGKHQRSICPKCLAQFKVIGVDNLRVELTDREEDVSAPHELVQDLCGRPPEDPNYDDGSIDHSK